MCDHFWYFFLLRAGLCWRVEHSERGQKTHPGGFSPDLQPAADGTGSPAGEVSRGRPPPGLWKAVCVPHQAGRWEECSGVWVWQQGGAHSGEVCSVEVQKKRLWLLLCLCPTVFSQSTGSAVQLLFSCLLWFPSTFIPGGGEWTPCWGCSHHTPQLHT